MFRNGQRVVLLPEDPTGEQEIGTVLSTESNGTHVVKLDQEYRYEEDDGLRELPATSMQPLHACCACDWQGPLSETCMLGAIGPLCPECREVTQEQ